MSLIKSINWIITYRCNAKCMHCDIWKSGLDLDTPLSDVKKVLNDQLVLDSYKEYGPDFDISLCGGEPFLLENLQEIVDAIENKLPGSFKAITTNGFCTSSILKFINQNRGLNFKLNISIDGLEQVHDTVRGIKGAFNKVTNIILKIRKINPKQKIELKLTLIPLNHDQIVKVYRLARRLRCDFSFKPAENMQNYTNRIKKIDLSFNKEQLATIRNQSFLISEEMYREAKFREARFFRDIPFYLFSKQKKTKCSVLEDAITIMPDGKVYTCLMLPSVGNSKKRNIKYLWNEKTDMAKECPSCMLMCGSYKDYSDEYYKNKVANVEATTKCNLSCKMCSQKELKRNRDKDMDIAVFKKLIQSYPDIAHVSFVGGEPFLNKDFFNMMGFLDTKGVTYEITTNGSLVGIREIERLKDCVGLKSINFSLDGLREYHDNERGNGIFDKCSDAIKLSNNFLNVSISTVLKSDNLTEIPRLTRYLTSLNIKRQKIIFGMSINENIRKKTKEILPVLELQGPYFKEYLKISDSQKVKALLKIMDSFVGQNKIYITYENLKSGIQDITMEDFKYKPGVSASCRQLSGYRFNSSGQRIICEFIRNKYDLRIAAYLNNVFLPICSYCCKLDINPEGTGFGLDKIARNA